MTDVAAHGSAEPVLALSLFHSEKDNQPQPESRTWAGLAEMLLQGLRRTGCTTVNCPGKNCPHKNGYAWSPASYAIGKTRHNDNVLAHACIVLDLDHLFDLGTLAPLRQLRCIICASHSDRPGDRCMRAAIATTRPILAHEIRHVRAVLAEQLKLNGIIVDPQTKDLSRLYYMPSRPSDADYHYETYNGGVLDVDRLLSIPVPEALTTKSARISEPIDFEIPEFAGAPSPERLEAAAQALANIWPRKAGRYGSHFAVSNLLALNGWPEKAIAPFTTRVNEIEVAYSGGEICADRRWDQARRSCDDAHRRENGEDVEMRGWPHLRETCEGERAVVDATLRRVAVELGLPAPEFLDETPIEELVGEEEAGRLREEMTQDTAPPNDDRVRTALEATRKKLIRSTNERKAYEGKLLDRVLRPDPQGIPDPATFRDATIAVARYAPEGTTPNQIQCVVMAAARGDCVGMLAAIVQRAIDNVRQSKTTTSDGEFTLDEKTGKPRAKDQHNFDLALAKLGVTLRFNELTGRKQITREGGIEVVVQDEHLDDLYVDIDREFEFQIPMEHLRIVVGNRARENTYHPVRDYLNDVQGKWDGEKRVETWLHRLCGAVDTPLLRAVSRIVLVAAVRRARRPGCKYDEMLILESNTQGTDKTQFIEALCPDKAWFGSGFVLYPNDQRKMIEQTKGRWIIEAGELAGMSKSDHRDLKQYLSLKEDSARAAYKSEPEIRQREFILIGTTNENEYLVDKSGNRRTWPVTITKCDVNGLRAELEQLWAEAATLEAKHPEEGYIRLDPSLYEAAGIEQEKRREKSPIEYLLTEALGSWTGRLPIKKVWELAGVDTMTRKRPPSSEAREIDLVMTRLGWIKSEHEMTIGHGRMSRQFVWMRGAGLERECVLDVVGGVVVLVGKVTKDGFVNAGAGAPVN